MCHRAEPVLGEEPGQEALVSDVAFDEPELIPFPDGLEVLDLALAFVEGIEVVETDYFPALGQGSFNEMAADEAGRSRHEHGSRQAGSPSGIE